MTTFLKVGDTAPPYAATLRYEANQRPIGLVGASVTFRMRDEHSKRPAVGGPCVVVNADGGEVRYEWAAGDTSHHGKYRAEFTVTHADGTTQTVPSRGYLPINIEARVT